MRAFLFFVHRRTILERPSDVFHMPCHPQKFAYATKMATRTVVLQSRANDASLKVSRPIARTVSMAMLKQPGSSSNATGSLRAVGGFLPAFRAGVRAFRVRTGMVYRWKYTIWEDKIANTLSGDGRMEHATPSMCPIQSTPTEPSLQRYVWERTYQSSMRSMHAVRVLVHEHT